MQTEGTSISWLRAASWQMPTYYMWALLTPLVLWLGRRWRIDRRRWLRGVGVHVLLGLAVAATHLFLVALFNWWLAPYPVEKWGLLALYGMLAIRYVHLELLIYAAILGVGYSFDYYHKLRERDLQASQLQAQLVQAQLQALKMQLHPHFLFNTLNAISVMVRKGANQEAVRMLAGLSDLLRMALDNQGAQCVSLRQELEFLERYLALEQIRFQDRLQVKMKIQPETLHAQVPNLILQPIVENAICHGIAARADAGLVELRTWREDGSLMLQVRDDGPGLHGADVSTAGQGLGLTNTRARLEQLYGRSYRFDIKDGENGGAVATLEIPFSAEPPRPVDVTGD